MHIVVIKSWLEKTNYKRKTYAPEIVKVAIYVDHEYYSVWFPYISLEFAERPWVKVLTSNFPNTVKQMC